MVSCLLLPNHPASGYELTPLTDQGQDNADNNNYDDGGGDYGDDGGDGGF